MASTPTPTSFNGNEAVLENLEADYDRFFFFSSIVVEKIPDILAYSFAPLLFLAISFLDSSK